MKIAVGMSGGVDSTLAAWLLKEQGHEVTGLTMKIWDGSVNIPDTGRSGCYGPGEKNDIAAARAAAEQIGIPHKTITLSEEFNRCVLNYFRSEYKKGHTPNPCVVCNHQIKFGFLLKKARETGLHFDSFATGHYAIISLDQTRNIYRLLRGTDKRKDQSYFLFRLTQAELANTLFPLGNYQKTDVVEMARRAGFVNAADRKQSQDFIESDDYSALFSESDSKPGHIVDESGRVLGTHRGIVHYTTGQREGLGIASTERLYVKQIDPASNTITLAKRDSLMSSSCLITDPAWISGAPPEDGARCVVQLRYRHAGTPATIYRETEQKWRAEFDEPQFAVTPGQAAVCYNGEETLGGGWIENFCT